MAAEIKNPDLIDQEKRHESFEEELRSVQEQINLSSKRNSVESFSSLSSKADLCGKYNYSLKLIYGCIEEFLKKRRIELQNEFGREDYHGGIGLSEKLNETEVMRYLDRRSQPVHEYVTLNTAIFDRYEDELHMEQFEMSMGTVEAIQVYLGELRRLHRVADTLLDIFQRVHKRAIVSRNAIALLDSFKQDQYNEMKKSGRKDEIVGLPITTIELFKDGDLLSVKVKVKDQGRGRGSSATLETSKVTVNLDLLEEE